MDLNPIGGVRPAPRRVVLRRAVRAGAPALWRALTEPAGLSAWLGRVEGPPLGAGVTFDLWHEEQVCSTHEVLEWVPARLLTLTWEFPGEAPSRVRFAVEHDAVGTVVALEHEGADDPVAYAAGWHVHLDFLAEHLRGRPRAFEDFWTDYEELVQRYRAQAQQVTPRGA